MFVNKEPKNINKSLITECETVIVDETTTKIKVDKMASSLISSDDFDHEELPQDAGFHLEVHETNYHFEKRFAVHGYNTVGQLILFIVREIGECFKTFT